MPNDLEEIKAVIENHNARQKRLTYLLNRQTLKICYIATRGLTQSIESVM
jgi:predicted DNA-binding ArsR family transcriptional regulator